MTTCPGFLQTGIICSLATYKHINVSQSIASGRIYLGALQRRGRRAAPFSVLQQGPGAVDQMPKPVLHGLPQTLKLSLHHLTHLLHLSADQALQQLFAAPQGRAHMAHLLRGAQGLGTEGQGHQTLAARCMLGREALPLFLRRRRRAVMSYYWKSGSLEED